MSLYAGIKYQDVFSKVGAFSPSIWAGLAERQDFVLNCGKRYDMKYYLYAGKQEGEQFVQDVYDITNLLKETGFNDKEVNIVIDSSETHGKMYWKKYFPESFL